MSKNNDINSYVNSINKYINKSYSISQEAKSKNKDPNNFIETRLAENIAQRVEGLIGSVCPKIINSGLSQQIEKLEKKYGKLDWRIAFIIAKQVAKQKIYKFQTQKEAIEIGIRIAFAYITLGVVSAPLEGFVGIDIKKREKDNKEYISIKFAGPIRAAGGTAGALCVVICDYLRKEFKFASYDVQEDELKRYSTEILDYNNRVARLQYLPDKKEIEFLISKIGIEITGSPTSLVEVSAYKELKRIPTNRIRGGMCLVVGECLVQKAPKLSKRLEEFKDELNLKQWSFLKDFIKLQKQIKSKTIKQEITSSKKNKSKEKNKILSNYSYLKDIVAGRPVFSFPSKKGGFRLRYGRCRTSGFASYSISPYTMAILDDFLAVGTQLRLERPGKSTIISACDTIESPIVKLNNQSVIKLDTKEKIEKYSKDIQEIIHLGDILISYGEFKENNHILAPAGYCQEQWTQELIKIIKKDKYNS